MDDNFTQRRTPCDLNCPYRWLAGDRFNPDLEVDRGKVLGQAVWPFERDCVSIFERFVEPQIRQLRGVFQTIGVDMQKRNSARIIVAQGERWARGLLRAAEPFEQALDQLRFAGAERTLQRQDHRAGAFLPEGNSELISLFRRMSRDYLWHASLIPGNSTSESEGTQRQF